MILTISYFHTTIYLQFHKCAIILYIRRNIMKNIKIGTTLIIIGNILYITYIYFSKSGLSNFGDFFNGLLLGLSIGINLIGIILTVASIAKKW